MASSDDEIALMLMQLAAKLQERKAGVEGQPQEQPDGEGHSPRRSQHPDGEGHSPRRSQHPMEHGLWLNDGTDDLLEYRDENVHMELRREIRRASDAGLLGGAAALAPQPILPRAATLARAREEQSEPAAGTSLKLRSCWKDRVLERSKVTCALSGWSRKINGDLHWLRSPQRT